MTESDWWACQEPQKMLASLRDSDKASDRKLRLFVVACCRRVWHLLADERSRRIVGLVERHADGLIEKEDLGPAWADARDAVYEEDREASGFVQAAVAARDTASGTGWWPGRQYWDVALSVARSAAEAAAKTIAWSDEREAQAALLHDIFGNPFRPVSLPPSARTWNAGTVQQLALAAYEERELPSGHLDQDRLAVLADALLDAGCPAEHELLAHLRSPGPHSRGCWAVDLLLSME